MSNEKTETVREIHDEVAAQREKAAAADDEQTPEPVGEEELSEAIWEFGHAIGLPEHLLKAFDTIANYGEQQNEKIRLLQAENTRLREAEAAGLEKAAERVNRLYGHLFDTTDGGGFVHPDTLPEYDAAFEKLAKALATYKEAIGKILDQKKA